MQRICRMCAAVRRNGKLTARLLSAQVILSRSNPLIGHTATSCDDIMTKYEAAIVAVRPAGATVVAVPSHSDLARPASSRYARPLSVSIDNSAARPAASSTGAVNSPGRLPKSPPRLSSRFSADSGLASRSPLMTPTPVRMRLGEAERRTKFAAGDALVLEVYPSFLSLFTHSSEFALVREVQNSKPPRAGTMMDKYVESCVRVCCGRTD